MENSRLERPAHIQFCGFKDAKTLGTLTCKSSLVGSVSITSKFCCAVTTKVVRACLLMAGFNAFMICNQSQRWTDLIDLHFIGSKEENTKVASLYRKVCLAQPDPLTSLIWFV